MFLHNFLYKNKHQHVFSSRVWMDPASFRFNIPITWWPRHKRFNSMCVGHLGSKPASPEIIISMSHFLRRVGLDSDDTMIPILLMEEIRPGFKDGFFLNNFFGGFPRIVFHQQLLYHQTKTPPAWRSCDEHQWQLLTFNPFTNAKKRGHAFLYFFVHSKHQSPQSPPRPSGARCPRFLVGRNAWPCIRKIWRC